MTARCARCKTETLPVAVDGQAVLVELLPAPDGDVQVHRWRAGWNGRRQSPSTPVPYGWTRHRIHVCPTPEEKP